MEGITSFGLHVLSIFVSLPIITQWAITILLTFAVIVHVFTFDERIVHDGPSIFTTGGIFFTFLGIAEGLYGFDPSQLDSSVPTLLSGLKTAFFASVVGVGIALTIKLRYALLGVRRKKTPSKTKTGTATVDDLYNQMVAVERSLVGEDDSTLLSQIKLARQDTNDRLDDLRKSQAEFMQRMAENNSKALIQALQEVIREFNVKISEQFGDNFKKLNDAVGKLLTWQEAYRVQLTELVQQETKSAENMALAADRYGALVSKAESFTTTAAQLSSILNGLEVQRKQLDESLRALGQLFETSAQMLPQVQNKILQLTEQMTFGVKHHQDEVTKTLAEGAIGLQTTVADIKKVLLESTQTANQEVNSHIKQLSEKTTEELKKLDIALDRELTKSLSTLGGQLAALSKQFVDDYTPLTRRLREVVQLANGRG